MGQQKKIKSLLIIIIALLSFLGFSQEVANMPEAFKALSSEPEVILINNKLKIPSESGHFQGVQLIEKKGSEKLLISGSSLTAAYILQINLKKRKTDNLITLMTDPYRHAGGIQVSEPYMIVGIEDNILRTTSHVRLYNYENNALYKAQPNLIIERHGKAKEKTAGATGLLRVDKNYLAVVSNWDSRNWDFYHLDPEKEEQKLLFSFTAPDDWGSYQSINLVKDGSAIYAIGFYKKDFSGQADLILIGKHGSFEPIMEKVDSKTFNCKNGVDFNAAVGLQVDNQGKLIIWSTQTDPGKQIAVNRFVQK
tara:strand:+ start:2793 stop:3716 length:924 start_codon:yes stop_codon:yes gene_type:complete